jgi:predicted RNase H-like HicB family nuclease
MKYLVIFDKAKDGSFGAVVPDLPGCTSSGRTMAEAKANIKEAIELYIEVMEDDGHKAPAPSILKAQLIEVE